MPHRVDFFARTPLFMALEGAIASPFSLLQLSRRNLHEKIIVRPAALG